jgi:hypothetical protein
MKTAIANVNELNLFESCVVMVLFVVSAFGDGGQQIAMKNRIVFHQFANLEFKDKSLY